MASITAQTLAAEIRRQRALSTSITADQTAISTGLKVTAPSQDPLAWVQISDLARLQSQQAAWTANVAYGLAREDLGADFRKALDEILAGTKG